MKDLSLNCTAIGSLPYLSNDAPKQAMELIFGQFAHMPFFPQLPHYSRLDDMILQFCHKITGLENEGDKYVFKPDSDEFCIGLEELFTDYESVLAAEQLEDAAKTLDKYGGFPTGEIFEMFLKRLEKAAPKYVKSSITGPFTFATSLSDENGKCAFYDDVLKDVVLKSLTLKALWQMKEFRRVVPNITPIMFMDEPSVSQVGSCAFLTVEGADVKDALKQISDVIRKFGGISAVHCCGKTDWDISFDSGVDIINFDAFFFSESLGTFAHSVDKFLKRGGVLAFGIVPTLDKEALKGLDEEGVLEKFEESVKYLTDKNIDKALLLRQAIITPSCGCGSLGIEEAEYALSLTKKLSELLREKYGELTT
jgi:methionine synthase II (cobalamin-independent)